MTTTPDTGVLAAPTGDSPTGTDYNKTHWMVLDGDQISGTILNATDAVTALGAEPVEGDIVWVEIKSTDHGNTYVEGTYHSDNSITFTWTVEAPDGSDICSTTIVAYETQGGFNGGDQSGLFTNTSNDLTNDGVLDGDGNAAAGFAIVNADGSDHECTDEGGQAALALSKDTVCPDDLDSVNGGTILADKPIEWVYTLTNTGDPGSSVSDITLTDSVLGTLYANGTLSDGVTLEGDTHNFGQLDSDETRGCH